MIVVIAAMLSGIPLITFCILIVVDMIDQWRAKKQRARKAK